MHILERDIPFRDQTRIQRYQQKVDSGKTKTLPVQTCCINFGNEINYLEILRASACYGSEVVHLIGNYMGSSQSAKAISGTTNSMIQTAQHKTPNDFIWYCRDNGIKILALELPEDKSISVTEIYDYQFDFSQKTVIVGGNENTGVPLEILKSAEVVFIPMPGFGYCLNVAQAVNVALYEASRQYHRYIKNNA